MPAELKHYTNKIPHYKETIKKLNLKKNSEPPKKYRKDWKKKVKWWENKSNEKVDNTYQSKGVVGVLVDFILLHVQNFVKNNDTTYKDSIDDDLILKTANKAEEGKKCAFSMCLFAELWEKEVTKASAMLKQFRQELSNAYKAEAAGKNSCLFLLSNVSSWKEREKSTDSVKKCSYCNAYYCHC